MGTFGGGLAVGMSMVQPSGAGGGAALAPPSVTAVSIGANFWEDATITNTNLDVMPVEIAVSGSISTVETSVVVPASGTTTVRVYRNDTASGSGTITITGNGVGVIGAVSWANLSFESAGIANGAAHVYAFATGATTDDTGVTGSKPITNTARGTFGAAAITGADGSLEHDGGSTESPHVVGAPWNRNAPRTIIYAVTLGTLTATRSFGMGPGGNNATTAMGACVVEASQLTAQSPPFLSSQNMMSRTTVLYLICIRTGRTDSVSKTMEHFWSRSGTVTVRQIQTTGAAAGTAKWWFGGDASLYFGHPATYHFLHAYDRVLSTKELNTYATLLGVEAYTG